MWTCRPWRAAGRHRQEEQGWRRRTWVGPLEKHRQEGRSMVRDLLGWLQLFEQAVEEDALVGVEQAAGVVQDDEAGLIHLPGLAVRFGLGGGPGVGVDALAALHVVDVAQVDQGANGLHT